MAWSALPGMRRAFLIVDALGHVSGCLLVFRRGLEERHVRTRFTVAWTYTWPKFRLAVTPVNCDRRVIRVLVMMICHDIFALIQKCTFFLISSSSKPCDGAYASAVLCLYPVWLRSYRYWHWSPCPLAYRTLYDFLWRGLFPLMVIL